VRGIQTFSNHVDNLDERKHTRAQSLRTQPKCDVPKTATPPTPSPCHACSSAWRRQVRLERAGHDILDAVVANLAWCTAPWLVVEVVETVLREPLAPGAHGLPGDAGSIRNLAVVETIGRPQYHVGPQRIGACDLAAANAPAAVRHAPRR